ncbi:hypothetical protein HY251_02975 [bacterium]|nr:hypothetical protein [bacterium]
MIDPAATGLEGDVSFARGSDLLPLGAFLGRADPHTGAPRCLAFPQADDVSRRGVLKTDVRTVPAITFRATDSLNGKLVLDARVKVPSWMKERVNAHTFELWFKPALPDSAARGTTRSAAPRKQVLLAWESGEPEKPDMSSATALVQQAAQGKTWGSRATCKLWLEPDPGRDPVAFTLKARFTVDPPASAREPRPFDTTWTATTTVRGGTWHHAVLAFHARNQREAPYPTKHVQVFQDGVELKSWAGSEPDAGSAPGIDASGWPSEVDTESLILRDVLLASAPMLGTDRATLETFAPGVMFPEEPIYGKVHPVEIPVGKKPIRIGRDLSDQDPSPFLGLVDNVIFQGRVHKRADEVLERFDTWRPSLDPADPARTWRDPARPNKPVFQSAPDGRSLADPQSLTFRKHTPALEWDIPIQVVSFEWTAWKDNPNPHDPSGLSYIDIGAV